MKRPAYPLGTIVRSRKNKGEDILIYSLRRGRKHDWFELSGYNLVNECLFDLVSQGGIFEEKYEKIAQLDVHEMLTHKSKMARRLGYILAKNPKIKTNELYEELWKMAV